MASQELGDLLHEEYHLSLQTLHQLLLLHLRVGVLHQHLHQSGTIETSVKHRAEPHKIGRGYNSRRRVDKTTDLVFVGLQNHPATILRQADLLQERIGLDRIPLEDIVVTYGAGRSEGLP